MVGLAAQQLVDGGLVVLALDVPQGDVDGAHARVDDGAAAHAPEGGAEQLFPDGLAVEGVHADDELAEVLDDPHARVVGVAVGQAHFAEAADTLVRVDADAHGGAVLVVEALGKVEYVDAGDFHGHTPFLVFLRGVAAAQRPVRTGLRRLKPSIEILIKPGYHKNIRWFAQGDS